MKIGTNKMFRIATIGLAAGIAVGGCGFINRTTNAGLPESEMSTTAVGAASGAVIGGGLGAIVGSTSGSAGEGVAIGAVAGAATGAGIGYQLERDQRALSDHRKSLEAQQELIARQGAEINEMKLAASDTRGASGVRGRSSDGITTPELGVDITPGRKSAAGGRSKARGTVSGIRDGYRGNPRAKPFVADGQISSRAASPASARGRLGDREFQGAGPATRAMRTPVTAGKPRQTGAAAAGVGSAAAPIAKAPALAAEPLKNTPTTPVENTLVAAATTSGLPPARLEVTKDGADDLTAPTAVTKDAPKTGRSAKAPKDEGDCLQATKEAERGLNASSDADRIFYLRRAARLCPDEPAYHVELGKLYSEIGKHNDAKFEFRQAIDLDPDNQIARDELSILENSGGQ